MILLLRQFQPGYPEFAPAMADRTGILPGFPAVAGKPVDVAVDGGRMTSDSGILRLAAIEQQLGIPERLAKCIADPRAPERVQHGLAEMIRYRALLIAPGYPRAAMGRAARRRHNRRCNDNRRSAPCHSRMT